jgi:osmotically-inducible protein OsmY
MTMQVQPTTARGGRDGPACVDARGAVDRRESVSEDVERVLRGSSHFGLRRIRCKYVDGVATLTGDVSSYYLKQVAQTIVGQLPQVRQVKNEIRVVGIIPTRLDS